MTQTFQQLQKQIEALRAKAELVKRAELKEVVAKIKVAIEAYGISKQDLFGAGAATTAGKQSGPQAKAATAKYSDGNGNTWVGIGKRPRWLQEALAAGRRLEEFLAGSNASPAPADAPVQPAGTKPRKKKLASKGGKAKYRDNAGNSWTGFGPKPGWLKDAIASGKSLEELRA